MAAAVGGIWVLGATDENLDCFVDALNGLWKFVERSERQTIHFKGGSYSQISYDSLIHPDGFLKPEF